MTSAFWVTGPGQGKIGPAGLNLPGADGTATVRTLFSGISRGTESLVFSNQIPESEFQSMRAPFQEGDFPFPVKYGYANVGRVIDGPQGLQGRSVFTLFPHQEKFGVPVSALNLLPEGLPEERAVLAANMETAVNGLWDAAPRVGERIAVVGLGVVGCLVAWLASRVPGTRVTAIDVNPGRRATAEGLGLDFATEARSDDHDLVFHASGHPAGLETALSLCALEARIIEMSWYGEQSVPAPLGKAFHSRRLTIRSSQVGQLNPHQKPRWDYPDRMQLALRLLRDPQLDCLISGESPFQELPKVMASLSGKADEPGLPKASDTLCHRIIY
ncbi:zinc-dependent alcohol dehydrogenase [Marinobacter confluentis]|uniref:Zinc-binding alcohol dehydrogenase n=1 Tax=Marinobacter confluentis TaxID=1697557 RepID=A0A4Z1CCN7_9GAMM|nr:zinc-binding alcohol dehydrogenase [Marinobacter confluentis]TGN42026.1 zinc-binding alcohol dehydrogenase [Marinobacter confluentis]